MYLYIPAVPGQAGGGSFRGERTYKPTKEFALECAQGHQPVRCPNRVFFFVCVCVCVCVRTSLQPIRLVVVFWWWLVVFPWCAGGGDVMCSDVIWYDVMVAR